MSDTPVTEPTADEIAGAEAVLARLAAANKAKVDAAMPVIKEFVADPGFAKTLEVATSLNTEIPAGTPFSAHLNAIIIGMTNLQNDAAV